MAQPGTNRWCTASPVPDISGRPLSTALISLPLISLPYPLECWGAQAAAAGRAGRRVGAGVRPALRRCRVRRPPPLRGARAAPGPASAWNARGETAATVAAAQSAVARPWLSRWARDATESHRSSMTPPWKSSDSTRKGTTTTMGSNSTRTRATFSSRISGNHSPIRGAIGSCDRRY